MDEQNQGRPALRDESRSRVLPHLPLNALRAVDAVARGGSLRAAAEALGVVPGAVRQQLASLEAHLGIALFTHVGGRVTLNAAGQRLADAAAVAFDVLKRATEEIAGNEPATRIRLGAPMPFASSWLMKRIARLRDEAPGLELDVVPIHVSLTLADRPDLDAIIVGGEYRPLPDIKAVGFMDDEFGLVGAPGLLAALEGPSDKGVTPVTAIVTRDVPDLFDDWFRESGMPPLRFRKRIEIENLALGIAAAKAGLGILAAPRASIADELASGSLAPAYGYVRRPVGYRLCCRVTDEHSRNMKALSAWLMAEGGRDP